MSVFNDPKVRKKIMLDYLQLMISREDWHGVADAAMDLRDMAVEDEVVKRKEKDKSCTISDAYAKWDD